MHGCTMIVAYYMYNLQGLEAASRMCIGIFVFESVQIFKTNFRESRSRKTFSAAGMARSKNALTGMLIRGLHVHTLTHELIRRRLPNVCSHSQCIDGALKVRHRAEYRSTGYEPKEADPLCENELKMWNEIYAHEASVSKKSMLEIRRICTRR